MKAIAAFLLAVVPVVEARIFDTVDEAVNRYGQVVEQESDNGIVTRAFRKGAYSIVCAFRAGVCHVEVYTKPGKIVNEELSEDELEAFLLANKGGSSWEQWRDSKDFITKIVWRSDGQVVATYNIIKRDLFFITAEELRRQHEIDKDNLSGF
jgi:hypothetical protein